MIDELKNFGEVEENASLKIYNTYRVESICSLLLKPNSIDDLVEMLKILKNNNIKYMVLGNGSNIVLSKPRIDMAIVLTQNLNGIEIHENLNMVYTEAGVMLPKLVRECVNASLTGLEFAAGIPGSVGGSIYGNAGAYNSCIMDYVKSLTVLDKETFDIKVLEHEDIEYTYRSTMFKTNKKYIVLAVKFYLKSGDKDNSLAIMKDRYQRRVASQPLEFPSAGSVFRNPEGDFAGRIIESLNLKGKSIGGACVSEKHANFIINENNASPSDVYNLINYVHEEVKNKTGVDLIIEQEFID